MQQGDLIGIFSLLSIRQALIQFLPFLMALVLSARVLPLITHCFFTEVFLLTSEQCGTLWDSIHGSSGSGHQHSPHLHWLLLTSWPRLPQICTSSHILNLVQLFTSYVKVLSFLDSDTENSLSVSAFLFFLMSWLKIQHSHVLEKCFNINFILERVILVDWQSLALLLGIISELLNNVKSSTPGCSQDPTLRKLEKMKDWTSAHSKMLHLPFWFLLHI